MQSWVGLLESLALSSKPHTGQPVGMLHLQQYTAEGELTFWLLLPFLSPTPPPPNPPTHISHSLGLKNRMEAAWGLDVL